MEQIELIDRLPVQHRTDQAAKLDHVFPTTKLH